jgi:epoxyqueuosine reductase
MSPTDLKAFVKVAAAHAGFERCGVARAEAIGRGDYVRSWLDQGMAGSMGYLHRNLEKRLDPRELLPGAKSVIVVALVYKQTTCSPRDATPLSPPLVRGEAATPFNLSLPKGEAARACEPRGRIAMYAWGEDYHDVLRDKLQALEQQLRAKIAEPFECRICVDTAPIIEREIAAAAGMGWIAKNTLVIDPELGSFFFLGVMLTTLDIAPDQPMADHCGTCTACLDACPTQAFTSPYQMDASRCISYLTIEHRGDISRPFQEMMGDWIFGCDICQDVCPHNRKAPDTREARFAIRDPAPAPPLQQLLVWSETEYREKTRGSAISRAKLDMLKRNATIAANNQGKAP